jgi:N,N'-diacetyllegionaminate synthase
MKKVYIIAEAGVNHNGSLDLAFKLIEAAKKCGADAVKFQTFIPELNISKNAVKADYQISNTGNSESQLEMVKKLYLDMEAHEKLVACCKSHNIEFLSTPFDLPSIENLNKLGLETFKIPSGELTNYIYLKNVGRLNKKLIVSTGMCKLGEIEKAIDVLVASGTDRNKIALLHCNTEYPTPMKDVNLLAMQTIGKAFDLEIGYSDHTLGIEIPIAAVALGATIIEKHFTLDKKMPGPDHLASLEPEELANMVKSIRNIEKALGDGIKRPSESELKNIKIVRKSIHIIKSMAAGAALREEDLIMKRPADGGISPMDVEQVIGKRLRINVEADHQLKFKDLE